MRVPRTFVFVDSGFTNYTAAYGDDAAGRVLGAFCTVVRSVASERGAMQAIAPFVSAVNLCIVLAYMIGFKWRWGATFGYSAHGIQIVSVSGAPLTLMQVTVRYLTSLCSVLALGLGLLDRL